MYTNQDLERIRSQQIKRWLLLALPVVLGALLTMYAVIARIEALATGATIFAMAVLIFGYDMFIKPLHRYEVHLNNVLNGITHELRAPFVALSEDISEVEGVNYRTLSVLCYDDKNKPYDRMFYYDCELPLPAFEPGQMLDLVYHDHELASVKPAEADA